MSAIFAVYAAPKFEKNTTVAFVLPGITASVAQMVDALRQVAGEEVAKRVVYKADARIQAIVKTWPVNFRTPRALAMGFKPDSDVASVIRDYIADEKIKI